LHERNDFTFPENFVPSERHLSLLSLLPCSSSPSLQASRERGRKKRREREREREREEKKKRQGKEKKERRERRDRGRRVRVHARTVAESGGCRWRRREGVVDDACETKKETGREETPAAAHTHAHTPAHV